MFDSVSLEEHLKLFREENKEEPNFNIWGEISDSELVLEGAKVEQKIRKTIKTSQEIKN